ncbi:MAG: HAMP domain-containing sensor histidine kinase, partial [Pseudomonadota bacterium]
VLIVLVSLFLARRITLPLRSLADEAKRIGTGDLNHPIKSSGQDEVGVLASTMNDMRHELLSREQQMQMMLSGIAHEVRNPLGGIVLFTGLLRDEVADSPQKLEMVQRVEREVEHLKNVVNDFLQFARHNPPRIQLLDLGQLFEEIAEVLNADAMKNSVQLRKEIVSVEAHGDREQIRRAMLNLTRNAIQAVKTNGSVTLRCGKTDTNAFFEIEDTGSGMSPDILEKVFTPFFTTREKGTGLGLPLSKKIVDENGGTMNITSIPKQGTTVRVTLPGRN